MSYCWLAYLTEDWNGGEQDDSHNDQGAERVRQQTIFAWMNGGVRWVGGWMDE